eukprot:Sspe_Gene.114434::Locus_99981_Transcript_1_1_Confidence_1.000_Length_1065::g.114434::m.114434
MGDGVRMLHAAVQAGDITGVHHALQSGADVNGTTGTRTHPQTNNCNLSTLHLAAAAGEEGVVRVLLEAGGRIDAQDSGGATPLFYARTPEIFQLLGAVGADQVSRTPAGLNCLHYATMLNHPDVVPAAAQLGCVDARDNLGCTPLQWAAHRGRTAVLRALIAAGADLSAADRYGGSPLHEAARTGHIAGIAVLVEAGSNPLLLSHQQQTPRDVALSRKQYEAATLLQNLE